VKAALTLKQRIALLVAATVGALVGQDAGFAPEVAAIVEASPVAVLLVLWAEVRLLPFLAPMRAYAERIRALTAPEPVQAVPVEVTKRERVAKSGPVGVVRTERPR
jgi:hypothetical protein